MYPRVLAFLVALVLLMSGAFAPDAGVTVASGNPLHQLASGDAQPAGADSSAGDERSDEAAQSHAETLLDVPELLPGRSVIPATSLTMARLRPMSVADLAPPYLEGPQRPPCSAAVLA